MFVLNFFFMLVIEILFFVGKYWLNFIVVGVGIISVLGDFCYEIIMVILLGFFVVLGVLVVVLGLIEGVVDVVVSFIKMIVGYVVDKFGYCKVLVLIGYVLMLVG